MGDAKMKKNMICMAGLALSLFLMAGCSGGRGNISEKDFDIYENGKCIATIEEVEEADEDGCRFFDYLWDGEKLFSDRELETKRGIQIGSTVRELAEAYSGIFMRYRNSGESSENEYLLVDDFLKQIADYDTKEYKLNLTRWIIHDNFMDGLEAEIYVKNLNQKNTKMGELGEICLSLTFEMDIMRIDF